MNVLIAGASGFIGRNLVEALQPGHNITVVGRDWSLLKRYFPNHIKLCSWESLDELNAKSFDAIINLCGHNISASRWNETVKQQIIDSRVKTSATLIQWAKKQEATPHFYCANAIGIYGMQDSNDPKPFDEESPIDCNNPRDFLSEIGVKWQNALQPALESGMPVTTTRFGVVLKKGEGILKKLAPSFYCGLGAILGDGKQVISWMHIEDLVAAYLFLLDKPELTGDFNFTAPHPVSQEDFARLLAKAMNRPLFLKMPAWFIKQVFGEMGESLLLKGQRVLPKRLLETGYCFRYPKLAEALHHEFR
ncbi:MAG: TIGR01777 family oxidoreductase [Tatlockia sp.]|jgi:hypothetical protein